MKGAAVGAMTLGVGGMLAACSSGGSATSTGTVDTSASTATAASATTSAATGEMVSPTKAYDATTGHNFSVVPEPTTTVGTTLDNLKTALAGETKATTKYASWAKVAEKAGYTQISRLFNCTSDAEKIHIKLELEQAQKLDSTVTAPETPTVDDYVTDINLIMAANGEIYETSDMYVSFIKVAQTEGNAEAEKVFTRAKLAEGFHAQRYLDAYNNIDTPSEEKYYLCPVCGYIHKGTNITACPICLTSFSQFTAY